MANTIRHKRGTTTPGAGDLVTGELAINTSTGTVYTKKDDGSVVSVGGGGGGTWGSITGTVTDQTDLTTYVTGLGYLTDAPNDGSEYVRKNGSWSVATGGGGGVAWGGITGTVTDQTDLTTYVTGLGYQTSGDVSTYVTGLGYITDAPSDNTQYVRYNGTWQVNSGFTHSDSPNDGNMYARAGSGIGWVQIGTGTDAIATQNYVTSQGYQTASDVTTAITGLVTTTNARLQAMVESIRAVCNDASYGYDGSGYLYIELLTGALNLPVSNSQFSSSGKWFGSSNSGTTYSAQSVTLSSSIVRITFAQTVSWHTGTGLYYTEDGGTTWVESTLKFA